PHHPHILLHGFGERHLALAAIAALQALFADVVVTRVLGATDADSRGFLSTNAARERHGLLLLPSCGLRGSGRDQRSTATLRFAIHYFELLLPLGSEIHDVAAEALPVGPAFGIQPDERLRGLG